MTFHCFNKTFLSWIFLLLNRCQVSCHSISCCYHPKKISTKDTVFATQILVLKIWFRTNLCKNFLNINSANFLSILKLQNLKIYRISKFPDCKIRSSWINSFWDSINTFVKKYDKHHADLYLRIINTKNIFSRFAKIPFLQSP